MNCGSSPGETQEGAGRWPRNIGGTRSHEATMGRSHRHWHKLYDINEFLLCHSYSFKQSVGKYSLTRTAVTLFLQSSRT